MRPNFRLQETNLVQKPFFLVLLKSRCLNLPLQIGELSLSTRPLVRTAGKLDQFSQRNKTPPRRISQIFSRLLKGANSLVQLVTSLPQLLKLRANLRQFCAYLFDTR